MIRAILAVALGASAAVAPELPNPTEKQCFVVGQDVVETEPTFVEQQAKITEFRLMLICGELHPGATVGEVVQRDDIKVLTMDETQAELIVRAAQDWLDQGLLEPDLP